jgi:hypothetical protein
VAHLGKDEAMKGNEPNLRKLAILLKIDIEGMETEVLHGFEAILNAGLIQAVQFEHGPYHIVARHFLGDFANLF